MMRRGRALRRRYGHARGPNRTIVVTWVEDSSEFYGPEARVDLGERRASRPVRIASAALWKASGTSKDLRKAKSYAADQLAARLRQENDPHVVYRVFTYPTSDADWKEHAKQDALAKDRG